jgi:hypothetical protein
LVRVDAQSLSGGVPHPDNSSSISPPPEQPHEELPPADQASGDAAAGRRRPREPLNLKPARTVALLPENADAATRAISTMLAAHEGLAPDAAATSDPAGTFDVRRTGAADLLTRLAQTQPTTSELADRDTPTEPRRGRRTDAA